MSPSRDLCEDAQELDFLITRMKDLLVEHMDHSRQPDSQLVDYKEPKELEQLMDFVLPDHGIGSEAIFSMIKQTLQYSVNTFSPRFMDKLYAGSNPVGVLTELLLAGLNGNSHVYHVSPVFTMMEIHVTRALARLFGFTGELAGGLSCPGGSASNQLAMVTARNALYPEIKKRGYIPRLSHQQLREYNLPEDFNGSNSSYGKLIAFTSSAGHYSLEKSAVIMGLGTENIVGVPCDANGAMIPEELERLIVEHISMGHTPFFINVTAGTTVLGAFDPIRPCGEIAQKYNCWFHIDGSWGGCMVFVPELAKDLLDGSEMANSITINPHKMLQTSLQCSLLLVQDTSVFPQANALNANYLFHGQTHDLGDGTLGCGRRSDAVKLFIGWKYYGRLGYQTRIQKSLSNVERFIELLHQDNYQNQRVQMLRLDTGNSLDEKKVRRHGTTGYKMPSLLQVCFWYRPKGSRLISWQGKEDRSTSLSAPAQSNAEASCTKLEDVEHGVVLASEEERVEAKNWMNQVTKAVHSRIRARGKFMLDYAPLGPNLPLFFRIVLNPPTIRELDLIKLVQEILECGEAVGDTIPIPDCCQLIDAQQ
ncbi:Glutamate decarboxylase 2 [Lunasporangiospora selenospora]|uniref:Glutamate decarboxylase 2 n=1 Tax=Lunasporangiospora selenospora TaxID=979761 RepID=A0A9P6KDB3_9FUNG|nr:Glutamate decarboxylase 2 [Lunasporangiospora selenospora]